MTSGTDFHPALADTVRALAESRNQSECDSPVGRSPGGVSFFGLQDLRNRRSATPIFPFQRYSLLTRNQRRDSQVITVDDPSAWAVCLIWWCNGNRILV